MLKITVNDDISGIQRLIEQLAAAEGISLYELAERSGLHPTTLYAILKKRPGPHLRPIRRETIRAMAEGNHLVVTFDAEHRRVILERSPQPKPSNDVDVLLEDMRSILSRSRRSSFPPKERHRILKVLGALVSS